MIRRDDTICAAAGVDSDPAHGAVMPPLNMSVNFSFAGFGEKRRFDYTRSGNPTRSLLGEALSELEQGAGAIITATGMAAVDLVLAPLRHGAIVVAPKDCYGGTWRLFEARARKGAICPHYCDYSDPDAVTAALSAGAELFWIETPSNPLLRITDIESICRLAHAVGAKVAVDNTFLSPALQKPITLGADFVVHSTTKYINGHSDVVGGAAIAADAKDVEELTWWANCTGVTGAPFDAYQTLRGLRTLGVRVRQQCETAREISERLTRHHAVAKVYHPGLHTHPGHQIARRQQRDFGAMVSFELKSGLPGARACAESTRLFTLAESLGGVESLLAHPATMTHAAMSAEARADAGISDGLLRLSIGLEHIDDLWRDLSDALARANQGAIHDSATRTGECA